MNPAFKGTVKEEIQKLLVASFIYPISNIQWLSPLVFVPKKKWEEENLCRLQVVE